MDFEYKKATDISLEATDMGRKLYERYGFVSMTSEMELPIKYIQACQIK